MKKLNTAILCSVLTSTLFAKAIAIQDGEGVDLILSKTNFNRLSVKGDEISEIRFLEGAFTVEKNEKANLADNQAATESIYLRPTFEDELTLFIETRKKHHFLIRVRSDEQTGKDIQLVLAPSNKPLPSLAKAQPSIKKLANIKSNNASERIDELIIEDMAAHKTPKNFDELKVNGQPFYLHKTLKVTLAKSYQGNGLKSYIYRVENTDKKPVELKKNWFESNKNLRAIKLSESVLSPGQSAWLYSVYNTQIRDLS
ncbi:type-F conjugative transfer system secretin TraK [Legionella busanensis]|uniref:Type-F conjugative transfer system secretin TraK n=1 Tax=Legionella busanensis TaxID=190655 RepID=A0A378K966_9GAMM|nr:type-F conjugative transfer system secretin TraK [Legionella busanensis]STX81256.1 type-F conjugative transfer system secretin TraK [Legionella busanensis]